MELHQLKIFNLLASELSFSKVASLLYISQPAVSIQIKKLETDLDLNLFDKSERKLHLTESGKILYEYTRKIFTLVEEAESVLCPADGHIGGAITIGASNIPGIYILPKIMGEFRKAYPNVLINLHIGNTYEVERLVSDNRIDFAVNGGNITYEADVYVERLATEKLVLIVSPSNKLAERKVVEPDDLVHEKYIAHEKTSQLYKLVERILGELGFPNNIDMTLGSIEAIKQAVAADLGISFIPGSAIVNELSFGVLKKLQVKDKSWFYPFNLIYNRKRHLSPAANKLMQMVREKVKIPLDAMGEETTEA